MPFHGRFRKKQDGGEVVTEIEKEVKNSGMIPQSQRSQPVDCNSFVDYITISLSLHVKNLAYKILILILITVAKLLL